MRVFDLKAMVSHPYEEREKNIVYNVEEFKVRIIVTRHPFGTEAPKNFRN